MKEVDLVMAKARRMTVDALCAELTRIDHALGIVSTPGAVKRWRTRRTIIRQELTQRTQTAPR